MKLLVDGVAFQTGPDDTRLWQSILPALVAEDDMEILVLDRGGLPTLDRVTRIPFPAYKPLYTADDSALIQRLCDFYAVDAFTSTGHTTPLSTPMFLLVEDMIPELFETDIEQRRLQERAITIAYAQRHVCLSERTRDDLLQLHPTLDHVAVAPPGIDPLIFRPVDAERVAALRARIGFETRPYLVTIGARDGEFAGNTALLLDTIATFGIETFDILCLGGEAVIDPRRKAMLPAAVQTVCLAASDADLATVLSGAAALIHPSRYDGVGLGVIEAMACGCPVVTTTQGALAEVAGDACLIVDSVSRATLAGALAQLRLDPVRDELRRAGLERVRSFDRATLIAALATAARATAALGDDAAYRAFAETWTSLRQMQAAVDTDTWAPA